MTLAAAANINTLGWWASSNLLFTWTGNVDFVIRHDSFGAPGGIYVELMDVPATRIDTGTTYNSDPVSQYALSLNPPIFLDATTWWISVKVIQ